MRKIFIITIPIILFCNNLILPNQNLFTTRYKNIEYIYSKDINISKIINYQSQITNIYNQEFGFSLDDTLYTTINSNNNQLANGISTQIPLNSQFFYNGGSNYIDYFCFNSWSKNLLIHETAHNFQLNPKENIVSRYSHKIFKNIPFTYIGLFPIFPIPNIMINPFILEGNSVLNESRFKNGGRLYSGYALAELIEMVNGDKIKPNLMYNSTLEFPYGEKSYLIGGFFQKFLAQKYGIKKVNRYFKTYSEQKIPLYINESFKKHFGEDFETLLNKFVKDIKYRYRDYRRADGEVLIKSQIYVPMNRVQNEILFLVGNFRDSPKIAIFNGKSLKFKEGSFKRGKVFKIGDKFYTQASMWVTPQRIKFGLFNENGFIKKGTEAKSIQGFLEDGREVYFNINKSFEKPHIYIDNILFDISNSSVFVDKKDIYYFKQQNNIRTLYKNKKALFSYKGYYGFITDVKEDKIYFIAQTKNGSGAYIFSKNSIKKAISGDNIIDLKIIGDNRAIINTIENSGYIYKIAKIEPKKSKIPEPEKLEFEKNIKDNPNLKLEPKKYYPIQNLKYSYLNQNLGFNSSNKLFFNIRANFIDPTTYNLATISVYKDNRETIGEIAYSNNQNLLKFEGRLYGAKYDNRDSSSGYKLNIELPITKKGYYSANVEIEYLKKYDSIQRPFSLYLNIEDNRKFGISKYSSSLNSLNIFFTEDRDNLIYGFNYKKFFQFGYQNFFEFNLQSIKSDKLDLHQQKGIKLNKTLNNIEKNPIEVEVLNIDKSLYTKDITNFELGLYKSFDTPIYYFSFPISIQRTTLYTKYKKYNIDNFNQTTFGIESDMVLFNNNIIPIKLEYIKTPYSRDNSMFRVLFGVEF